MLGTPRKAFIRPCAVQHTSTWPGLLGTRTLQRPFLPALLLGLPKPGARPKGEICAAGFGLSAFGFRFSRLLLCPFATSSLPSRFEVTDASSYSVDSPHLLRERRMKSSSTLAIGIFLRRSCPVGVDAKRPEQITRLLGSLRPCCGGSRDKLCFQLLLSIPERFLACFHLRQQAADLGCFLSGQASTAIERDGSLRHDRFHETPCLCRDGPCPRPVSGAGEGLAAGSSRSSGYAACS